MYNVVLERFFQGLQLLHMSVFKLESMCENYKLANLQYS
jgi:hypothetical protein